MTASASSSLLANAQLFELSPEHVDEGTRIGFLHEDKAAALGRLMAVDGQRDPIKVVANPKNADQPWRLVTGMHRLVGARIEGITIWAIEVSGKPDALADLEASENLHRRPLAPIERAKFTAALVQAAQERIAREHGDLSQQQLAIKARWARVKAREETAEAALDEETTDTCLTMTHVYGWEDSVGDALGLSRPTIHRDLQLFRLIIEPFPALIEALSKHPVVGENGKQLRDIAKMPVEGERKLVIEALLDDPELSVDEAKVQCGIGMLGKSRAAEAVPYQKHLNAVTGNLGRLTAAQQRENLTSIVGALKGDLVRRQMRDLLSQELGNEGDLKGALSTAFDVIAKLSVGEAVDDTEIEAARAVCQRTLFADFGGEN
ncbi:MAG: ParB/RepB/Spo0J family partition protein [Pseudomonadota bacterium]|nr:ParB/RepB/Spo0J family partition protein [Pseudomonadota bacterium]